MRSRICYLVILISRPNETYRISGPPNIVISVQIKFHDSIQPLESKELIDFFIFTFSFSSSSHFSVAVNAARHAPSPFTMRNQHSNCYDTPVSLYIYNCAINKAVS